MKTVQICGSKALGGAERWFIRFTQSLHNHGHPVHGVVRKDSELDSDVMGSIPYTGSAMRTVWDPLSRQSLGKIVEKQQPQLVQTYMGRATRLTHIPNNSDCIHVSRLGGYYKLDGYRHADAWIGNTKGICDFLVHEGMPSERVFHISNFADTPRKVLDEEVESLRQQFNIQADEFLILTPGRFVDFKGQRFALEALAKLPESIDGQRIRLMMLGKGQLEESLKQQAASANINEKIIWAGWQTDPAPWYKLADLVLFPSREREPLGNVLLEAWAYQRPLLTTNYWGAVEISHHGEDAWRVPCDDAAAIAEAIPMLIKDDALRNSLVNGGSATLQKQFSEQVIMNQYHELYSKLVEMGRRNKS